MQALGLIAAIFTVFWWVMPGTHAAGAGHWEAVPVLAGWR